MIYVNGKWFEEAEAKISVFDRGFLYGDGIFETMTSFHGRILFWDKHLERFMQGARNLGITPPHSERQLQGLLQETLERNGLTNATLRLTLTRGIGPRGLGTKNYESSLIIYCFERDALSGELPQAADTIIANTIRVPPICVNPAFKSANYLNQISAYREAEEKKANEAFMLNISGYLTEGTVSNLFFIKKNTLYTPAISCGITDGIIRATLLELAHSNGIPIAEGNFKLADLFAAEEAFYTNCSCIMTPVRRVNNQVMEAPGQLTMRLWGLFQDHINSPA